MTHNEGVALARRWMEGGASEREVREQLQRAGFAGREVDNLIHAAYRSRLRFFGKRSIEFEKKQLAVFIIGAIMIGLAPFTGAVWSLWEGFNLTPILVAVLGIAIMITGVKLRPKDQ